MEDGDLGAEGLAEQAAKAMREQKKYMQREFTKGSAAILKYRKLLREFGDHKSDCLLIGSGGKVRRIGWKNCTCGWSLVIREVLN